MLSSSPPNNNKNYMKDMENIINIKVNAVQKTCFYIRLDPNGGVEECNILWNDPQELRNEFHRIKNSTQHKKVWKLEGDHTFSLVMYCSRIDNQILNTHILPYGFNNDFTGSIYIFKERNEFPHSFRSWEYTKFFENSY